MAAVDVCHMDLSVSSSSAQVSWQPRTTTSSGFPTLCLATPSQWPRMAGMQGTGHLPTWDPSVHSPYARALHWGLALSYLIHLPLFTCLFLFLFISYRVTPITFTTNLDLTSFSQRIQTQSVDPESGPKQWIAKGTFRIRLLTAQLQMRTLCPSGRDSSQQKVTLFTKLLPVVTQESVLMQETSLASALIQAFVGEPYTQGQWNWLVIIVGYKGAMRNWSHYFKAKQVRQKTASKEMYLPQLENRHSCGANLG